MGICTIEIPMAIIILIGAFNFGFLTIYPSPMGKQIRAMYNLSDTDFRWTIYNAIVFGTAILGPFVTQFCLNIFKGSRKKTMFVIDLTAAIWWFLNCVTKISLAGGTVVRAFGGITMGMYSAVGSMYLIEIAPPEFTGFYGTLNQAGIVFGQALYSFLGSSLDYMELNYLAGAINILGAILIWWVKESPAIENGTQQSKQNNVASESLCQKQYIIGVVKGVAMMFMQQFCGINGILTNLSDIMSAAGLDSLDPNYQSGISIISQLVSVFCLSALVDKLGRKFCWILSSSVSAVALLMMALNEKVHMSAVVPLIAALLYQVGFGLGLGPIPWFLIPEYFPVSVRSKANMICVCSNWIFSFLIVLVFPSMKDGMTFFGALMFFMAVLVLSLLFGIFQVTEPKTQHLDNDEQENTDDSDIPEGI